MLLDREPRTVMHEVGKEAKPAPDTSTSDSTPKGMRAYRAVIHVGTGVRYGKNVSAGPAVTSALPAKR